MTTIIAAIVTGAVGLYVLFLGFWLSSCAVSAIYHAITYRPPADDASVRPAGESVG